MRVRVYRVLLRIQYGDVSLSLSLSLFHSRSLSCNLSLSPCPFSLSTLSTRDEKAGFLLSTIAQLNQNPRRCDEQKCSRIFGHIRIPKIYPSRDQMSWRDSFSSFNAFHDAISATSSPVDKLTLSCSLSLCPFENRHRQATTLDRV